MEQGDLKYGDATVEGAWSVMQLVESSRQSARHGDPLRVHHSTTTLRRGLDHGERVVLRTTDGEYHSATVTGLDFEPEDTIYTVTVGARLPVEMAAELLSGVPLEGDSAGVHEIVELLGRMKRRARA